jgi:hypothetical protein
MGKVVLDLGFLEQRIRGTFLALRVRRAPDRQNKNDECSD